MRQKITERYFGRERSAKAIYGLILITATLIGLKSSTSAQLNVAVETFAAAFIIVIAEVFSEIIGKKIEHKRNLSTQERKDIIDNTMTIALSTVYPTIIFVLSWLGLYSITSAFILALAFGIIGLGAFGYISARSIGHSIIKALAEAVIICIIGSAIILVKYYVWH